VTGPKLRIPCPVPAAHTDIGSQPNEDALVGPGLGTRVWLVRHALVHEDWHTRAYGGLDVPLSLEGERQTSDLSAAFADVELAAVTCSDLARAAAMGRGIAEATGASLRTDPRLREIDRGAWQGIPSADFRRLWEEDSAAFFSDAWSWKGHAGESDAELFARVRPAFDEAVRAAEGHTLAIAAHSNVIRVLLGRLTGVSAYESYGLKVDPAHATLVLDTPERWVVERSNVDRP
jgi:probable phosphoglycerate mutase